MSETSVIRKLGRSEPHPSEVACAVCKTHSRPIYVPWHQHAVGCPVRALELEEQARLRVVASIAAL